MATTKVCDMCKAIGAESQFVSFREHIHHSQHDGTYKNRDKREFDLCDKCAGKIEKLITGCDPDMEILD